MAKNEEKEPRSVREAAKELVMLPVSEVRPYEKNPRKNQKAVKFVKASIEKFGFKQPIIVDSNRVIVCGHTRLLAAKSLGMAEVPCIFADDLTGAQIKAYRLADNKVAEYAEWDEDLLAGELGDIAAISDFDMAEFGFTVETDEKELVEDEVPEEADPVVKPGEIWILGEHRLMCGDSTKTTDVYEQKLPTTVIDCNKPARDGEHPTMKPVRLFGLQITNSSRGGDIVLDTFGGSGTTIVACEQLGRKARVMELDPKYCDVIIARWEQLTGEKAVKAEWGSGD